MIPYKRQDQNLPQEPLPFPKSNFAFADMNTPEKSAETACVEKNLHHVDSADDIDHEGAVSAGTIVIDDLVNTRLRGVFFRFGIEARGIERVPSHERTDKVMSEVGTIWLSTNMAVSSFAIGALAYPVFSIGFVETCLTIVFVNILGILPVCFFSTFGPRFGLRQMVLSRFFFGWYGTKIIAVLNILACIGWSSVNIIVGAQLLNAVNPSMPGWAGILVISFATFIVTLFGYKIVHIYEHYAWIPCFIIFLVVLGEFAHSGNFYNIPMTTGLGGAGSVLSFAASIFGFSSGWTVLAADYTVYQPSHRSRISVFFWTFGGLAFPLLFTELLGAAVMTAVYNNQAYRDGYDSAGIGGVLGVVLLTPFGRFGEFCLVVLSLSTIANNCPNKYSVSLSLQILARASQRIPRFIWTFIATCIIIGIAVPGYSHFAVIIHNLMLLIGYWVAIYLGISLPEHIFFRRGFSGYEPEDYLNKNKLPPGFAAALAFCFGIIGGVLGMAQVWFTGPIGKLCGTKSGGDVGFELAFVFSAFSYCVFRYMERRQFGR